LLELYGLTLNTTIGLLLLGTKNIKI